MSTGGECCTATNISIYLNGCPCSDAADALVVYGAPIVSAEQNTHALVFKFEIARLARNIAVY